MRENGDVDSISIVIRCKNEEKFIGLTLEKIFEQEINTPFEVIVIDSGSTDRTIEIVKNFDVKLYQIAPETFTFGYALNYGIERAKGTIIANISAHCIPRNNQWLSELVRPIVEGNAGATYGRQIPVEGVNPFEEVSLYKHFPEDEKKKGRVPFSNAACAFLKEMWIERRFDEEMPSWEDYLWYLLMKDRYRFKYCPDSIVYHSHAFSMEWIKRRAFIDGQAFKLIKKKYGIDLLDGLYPTFREKVKWGPQKIARFLGVALGIFINDVKHHLRLFKKNGYLRQIFLIPIVRLHVYKAYWKGYRSVR